MVFLVMVLAVQSSLVHAQTTQFSYQGSLKDGANPANGTYDIEIDVFDAVTGGNYFNTITASNVPVVNGTFSLKLDLGANMFAGAPRFFQIKVRQSGSATWIVLNPRQEVTSSPYAVRSLTAATATNATNATTAATATNALSLGGVAAGQYVLTGDARLVDARTPTAGSGNYIQNQNAGPQSLSNFNVSGTGSANILNAGSQFNVNGVRVLSISGLGNIFVGEVAGRLNTGSGNSFFGNNAGSNNTSGSDNTLIGRSTGNNVAAGNQNTYIGAAARGFPDLTNSTAIGANAFVGSSNSLVLGDNANVGIGTSSPAAKLHVNNGSVRVTNGGIFIANPNTLVITSPNGACWGITVNNSGGLATFSTTCP